LKKKGVEVRLWLAAMAIASLAIGTADGPAEITIAVVSLLIIAIIGGEWIFTDKKEPPS